MNSDRLCHTCFYTSFANSCADSASEVNHCVRCGSRLHHRKPNSIARTWALLLSATILYIPANTLPMMTIVKFGQASDSTILQGILQLMGHGMVPVAIVVFVASILVPLFKIVGMTILLLNAQGILYGDPLKLSRLYRFIEWIGRWSMLDIFIISILAALVQQKLFTICGGHGATAFVAVVILTMLASQTFDPRLIWDRSQDRS